MLARPESCEPDTTRENQVLIANQDKAGDITQETKAHGDSQVYEAGQVQGGGASAPTRASILSSTVYSDERIVALNVLMERQRYRQTQIAANPPGLVLVADRHELLSTGSEDIASQRARTQRALQATLAAIWERNR